MANYVSTRVKELNIGISSYSASKTSLDVIGGAIISGVTTLASAGGITTTGGDFYVGGDLYVSDDITFDEAVVRAIRVSGASTFTGPIDANGTLDVDGDTQLDDLNVSGVSTFNNDVQFKGAAYNALWDKATSKLKFYDLTQATFGDGNDLQVYSDGTNGIIKGNDKTKITGITELTVARVNVTGVSTFAGIVTTSSDLYVGGELYVLDDVVFDQVTATSLNITGVSTFAGDAQFNGNVSIAGTLTYEDVTNVDSVGIITAGKGFRATTGGLIVTAGVSTFGAIATFTQNVFVDGTLTAGLIDGGSF